MRRGRETHVSDIWELEHAADEGQLAQEGEYDREEVPARRVRCQSNGAHATIKTAKEDGDAPKEVEEPKRLDDDADEGPFEEDEEDAADETCCPAQLLLAREEVKRLLGADDEC